MDRKGKSKIEGVRGAAKGEIKDKGIGEGGVVVLDISLVCILFIIHVFFLGGRGLLFLFVFFGIR